ncbi:MAG: hypothetical protein FJ042_01570 [Candidatus Cloacimonetes bacterium]|nr:hypothetical protein [Chloroflexota bacterium]MBM4403072.1 hypothetical protein [Candidatus Cloacimonadota bacterium]
MINNKIETFLEKGNMNYLYCLLANLEVERLNKLPSYVKQKLVDKLTEIAMTHVAENEVPDYLSEIAEAEAAAITPAYRRDDDYEYEPLMDTETVDDSLKLTDAYEDEEDDTDDFDQDDDNDD